MPNFIVRVGSDHGYTKGHRQDCRAVCVVLRVEAEDETEARGKVRVCANMARNPLDVYGIELVRIELARDIKPGAMSVGRLVESGGGACEV